MCVNPKVKRPGATGSDINHDCNRLGQERKCHFRNKLEGFTAPGNEPASEFGIQPVRDMEDLVLMGQNHRVCPFYYTRSLIEDAELILVPYNYLFDKDSRTSTLSDVPWKNAVVIFDEAHNLESFASESASFDLTTTDIAGCVGEIQRAVNYVQTFGTEDAGRVKPENIAKLKTIFLKLEEHLMSTLSAQTMSYKGEFMMDFFQKGAGINHANHEFFLAEVRKLMDVFLQFGGNGSGSARGAPRLEHFCQCIKRVFGETTEARCFAKAQSYRVHITQKQAQTSGFGKDNNGAVGRTVSYWCFAPSEAMRELANLQVRSILVTSGTLSPLESYALELDLPFPHRLENPHIIPADQIHVRVVGKGVSNKVLSSAYDRRQDEEYYTELGNTLISLAKIIPGGMLIFFPSYSVMEACLEKWGGPSSGSSSRSQGNSTNSFFAARKKVPTGSARYSFPHAPHTFSSTKDSMNPWKRLLGAKSVVVEPKATTDLPDAINEFHKFLNMPKSKGVALFGVCRGKISEGIDFAHNMCRAVIITGLPFAPSFDPKVKMKREFLDQNRSAQNQKASTDGGFGGQSTFKNHCLSGHEWYTQQAHRAVNQAIGRVIRNKDDYGAVLLLDHRFSLAANQQGLSKWVRPHILSDEGMGSTIGALSRFYREAAQKAEERENACPVTPLNPVSIILKYEEEGKEDRTNGEDDDEDQVTKIAYVANDNIARDDDGSIRNQHEDGSVCRGESQDMTYIRPDRIITKVDLDHESSRKPVRPSVNQKASSPATASGLHLSVPTQATLKDGSSEQSSLPTNPKGGTSSLTPAQQFFHIVQERMTKEEQSKMRHAAVAMKPENGKYGPKFAPAAREMIKIILFYDPLEGRSKENKPELINLLMQLFPKSMLQNMEKLTISMALEGSQLVEILREILKTEEFVETRSALHSLLQKVWFKDKDGAYLTSQQFLSGLEKLLSQILVLDPKIRRVGLEALTKLIPAELHGSTHALVEQLEAKMRISKLRAKERAVSGEDSVQVARFRPMLIKQEPTVVGSTPEESNTMAPTQESRLAINTDDSKAKRLNPYVKNLTSIERPVKLPKSAQGRSKSNSASMNRASLSSFLGSSTKAKLNEDDPLRIKLNDLEESDVFTGIRKKTIRMIDSNAPIDYKCQLCESPCEQVST